MVDRCSTRLAAAACLAAGLASGCGITDSASGPEKELARARTLWSDAGLTDYRYRVRQLCFCGYGGQLVEVEVRDSEVVSGTLVDSGESIPEQQLVWGAPSVDSLFSRLAQILEGGPALYSATFDPALGYPVSASTDPIENAIDDEWGVEASDLVEVTPGG